MRKLIISREIMLRRHVVGCDLFLEIGTDVLKESAASVFTFLLED
jgi:hypothetical protein